MSDLRKHLEDQLSFGTRVVALERKKKKREVPIRRGPILLDGLFCIVINFNHEEVLVTNDNEHTHLLKRKWIEGRFRNVSRSPIIQEVAHA